MNFTFEHLSYWEQSWLTDNIDFLIVGAGIVGLSSAYHIKKKHPKAKVLIIDKGILPLSASSKNAGFACFGSPSELIDDFSTMEENDVWKTVEMRWNGLIELKKWLGQKYIGLEMLGSWDLIPTAQESNEIRSKLDGLNEGLKKITGKSSVFSEDKKAIKNFGFSNLTSCFHNKLEGQLDTTLLIQTALKRVALLNIPILRGVIMNSFETDHKEVCVQTQYGELKAKNLLICTNGFTPSFENLDLIKPARAQVLITESIPGLKFKGTFHLDRGYYYFRNVGNRLLIGGGRNSNFDAEETTELFITAEIQAAIEHKIRTIVLPNTPFKIEKRWSGIMAVGNKKEPIIERMNHRVCIGVRMGGMGVAIGTLVGQRMANLHD